MKPPSPSAPRISRLPSLTGLRFLAALAVFAYHTFLPIPPLRLLSDNRTEYRLIDWTSTRPAGSACRSSSCSAVSS